MDFDENNVSEEQEGEYVEIYSKRAIFWFSVLASPIFGGALLAYNLKAAGYKKAVYIVGIFTVLFTAICSFAFYEYVAIYKVNLNVDFRNPNVDPHFLILNLISLGLKLAGGFIFIEYFFPKYFPEADYYPKNIFPALLVSVFVILVLGYISALLQIRIL